MQLEGALPDVEDAPVVVAEPAGEVLHGDLRHQVQVEFWPDPGQRPGEHLGALVRRTLHQVSASAAVRELRERGRVMAGPAGEPAADHDCLEPEVQPCRHDRVVEAGNHDDLVDERVIRAAQPPHLLAQRAFLLLGHVLDDEDLKVWPVRPGLLRRVDQPVDGLVLGSHVQDVAAAVGAGRQRAIDLAHQAGEPAVVACRQQPPQLLDGLRAREGPQPFDRPERVEQPGYRLERLLERSLPGTGKHQLTGCLFQAGPGVRPDLPQGVVRRRVRVDRHGHHLRAFAQPARAPPPAA